MKTKKPILIVCAAALTLALVLPFMGVFAFAEDSVSLLCSVGSRDDVWYEFYVFGESGDAVHVDQGSSVSLVPGVVYSLQCRLSSSRTYPMYNNISLSTDSSSPTVIAFPFDSSFGYIDNFHSYNSYGYFVLDVPPDPLAPVSDGLDASIDIFGQVIDYVVNTPSVAVFVALSVAAFAIVPAGIVIIKKLIKGY